MAGDDSQPARPDLVGRIAVGRHPVAAHETGLHPTLLHHDARHVVADQRHIDPRAVELVARQARPLQKRPRFVGVDVEAHAALVTQKQGAERRAVGTRGQRARIAVGDEPPAVLDEGQTQFGHALTGAHVFVLHGTRFGHKSRFDRRATFARMRVEHAHHPAQGPRKVHRGWAARVQVVGHLLHMGAELLARAHRRALGEHGEGCRGEDADRRRPAHGQAGNRVIAGFGRGEVEIDLVVGQPRLVEDAHRHSVGREFHVIAHGQFLPLPHPLVPSP